MKSRTVRLLSVLLLLQALLASAWAEALFTPSPSPSPTAYFLSYLSYQFYIYAEPKLPVDSQNRWLILGKSVDETEIYVKGGFLGMYVSLKDSTGETVDVSLDYSNENGMCCRLEGLSQLKDGEYTLLVYDSLVPEIMPDWQTFIIDRTH